MSDAPVPAAPARSPSVLKIAFGTALGGCGMLLGGVVVLVLLVAFVATKAKQKQDAEAARMDALPVSALRWEEIERVYGPKAGTTGLQKQEAWKTYRGQKVRWRGTLLGVHTILGRVMMQMRVSDAQLRQIVQSDVFVALAPGDEQLSRARALAPQAEFTIEGVLDHHHVKLGERWAMVTLKHGKIVP